MKRDRKRKNVAQAENRYFSQWKNAINNTKRLRNGRRKAHALVYIYHRRVGGQVAATEGDNISRISVGRNKIRINKTRFRCVLFCFPMAALRTSTVLDPRNLQPAWQLYGTIGWRVCGFGNIQCVCGF